ncbi:MAG TPA: hypothetical protein VM597_17620 [Gemmataceae bacterium]|nr:hypothetical protein [Gemmataceae bacterium]
MKDSPDPTAEAVADWMWETIRAEGELPFARTAARVRARFGDAFLDRTSTGRPSIRKAARDQFIGLHGGTVVRGGTGWYLRGHPGRGVAR